MFEVPEIPHHGLSYYMNVLLKINYVHVLSALKNDIWYHVFLRLHEHVTSQQVQQVDFFVMYIFFGGEKLKP